MAVNGRPNEKLTTKQVRAVAALLVCPDVASAAKEADVGERTLYKWLLEPDFRSALKDAERAIIDATVRRLAGKAGSALDTLVGVMEDSSSPASVRVRAATVVLEQLIKLREIADIEERITALEKAAQSIGQ